MAPPVLVTTLLSLKGEVRRAQVKLNEDNTLDIALLQAYFRKKSEPTVIGQLVHGDNTLYIIGYTEGKSGTENKYELPAPYDKTVIYGDALIIAAATAAASWTDPVTYLPLTWENYLKGSAAAVTAASAKVTGLRAADDEVASEDGEEEEELARHEDEESEPEDEDAASESDVDLEVEEEEEPVPVPKKKKKVANSATLSGYQRQNILLMSESKNELQASSVIDSVLRKDCFNRFRFMGEEALVQELELEIYKAALEEAKMKHIFAHWDNKLFEEIYIQRQRRLFSNLHPSSPVKNLHLLERVKHQELTMAELARLSDIELFPTNWIKLQEQQQVREHKWLEGNTSMKSDKFVCSRCHKRECSYYELQTRSADEPMTVFITCLNCNKKWRN
jgi:DNA-directed RNA polymerase subunit M/transcription elongation factor TFIIS